MMVPYLSGIYILEALEPVNNECHVQFGHHLFGLLELLLRSRSQRIRTSLMVLNRFHLRITIGPGERVNLRRTFDNSGTIFFMTDECYLSDWTNQIGS